MTDEIKTGYYYCKSCSNITFHNNKGYCENTIRFRENDKNEQD